jgi:hypothetical protein
MKAQGAKVTNVLNEFRVSGARERSFLIPNPRPPTLANFMVRPRLGVALPNRPAQLRSPAHLYMVSPGRGVFQPLGYSSLS